MKKYKPYLKKYWYCFLLGPLFKIIEAFGEFILPYINANMIDIGAANGDIPYILENGLYMLVFAVIMLISGVAGGYFAIKGASRLSAGVRSDIFRKVQTFSFSNIDDFTTGSLITRITNDVTQIQEFVGTMFRGMFRAPVMLIGAIIMSFAINPELARVLIIVVPVLIGIIAFIIFTAAPRYTAMQTQIDRLNVDIQETVTNEKVIKSFVREEYEKEKFSEVNMELVDKSIHALEMMLFLGPASTLAVNATTLAVVWFAGKQIMIGSMQIGELTAFITYLSQILQALNFIANIVLRGVRAAASDKRISAVLDAKVELNDDGVTDSSLAPRNGSITFDHVTFRYFKKNREKVLNDVSFSVKAGEMVGIIGPTGSGKTTLVSMIPRLYDTDEGGVLVDGHNVKEYPLEKLRESVAIVLQKNTLFSGTVAENLRWGNENATEEQIIHAAKIAQADSFIRELPDGYETEVVQGGQNLSGGQKQSICIARALLKKPQILILDDSTSAVDTATDASIRKALRKELKGITKIIIAQRINSVIDADKIIVMDGGEITGIGKHADLMKSCQAYQEIFWSQKDKDEEAGHAE